MLKFKKERIYYSVIIEYLLIMVQIYACTILQVGTIPKYNKQLMAILQTYLHECTYKLQIYQNEPILV